MIVKCFISLAFNAMQALGGSWRGRGSWKWEPPEREERGSPAIFISSLAGFPWINAFLMGPTLKRPFCQWREESEGPMSLYMIVTRHSCTVLPVAHWFASYLLDFSRLLSPSVSCCFFPFQLKSSWLKIGGLVLLWSSQQWFWGCLSPQ